MKNLFKNIFGDLFTTTAGAVLGVPEIIEGFETLPADKTAGILKLTVGIGTLLLGLLSKIREVK
jgi:hypothetical protein